MFLNLPMYNIIDLWLLFNKNVLGKMHCSKLCIAVFKDIL